MVELKAWSRDCSVSMSAFPGAVPAGDVNPEHRPSSVPSSLVVSSWPLAPGRWQRAVRRRGAPVETGGQRQVARAPQRRAQGQEPGHAVRRRGRAGGDQ